MKLVLSMAVAAALLGAPAVLRAGDDCCGKGGDCCGNKEKQPIAQVTTEELAKIVAEKKAVIIDVNPAARYAKGHVPGAINADYEKLDAKILPADKAAAIVFYCASEKCPASEMAACQAIALGYTNVKVYKPGIAGWEAAKQPTQGSAPATS